MMHDRKQQIDDILMKLIDGEDGYCETGNDIHINGNASGSHSDETGENRDGSSIGCYICQKCPLTFNEIIFKVKTKSNGKHGDNNSSDEEVNVIADNWSLKLYCFLSAQ